MTWKNLLYSRLKESPIPVFLFPEFAIPGASLWNVIRYWTEEFRKLSLKKGDVIILHSLSDEVFLALLLTCLKENLSLFIIPSSLSYIENLEKLPAGIIVSSNRDNSNLYADNNLLPQQGNLQRPNKISNFPDVNLWLLTSGTTGNRKWIGLSEKNIQSVLSSHSMEIRMKENSRILSILPWWHCYGLVMDLLLGVFSGGEFIRTTNPRDFKKIAEAILSEEIDYFSCVPLTIEKLIEIEIGREALLRLKGGIVGGAPISKSLADFLKNTKLRVGYGQTEASPGILLGEVGEWRPFILGRPIGCEVKIDKENILYFKGDNAYSAIYENNKYLPQVKEDWVDTGDKVKYESGCYYFLGRESSNFKLNNGLFVDVVSFENKLKEIFPEGEFIFYTEDYENLSLLYYTVNEKITQNDLSILGSISRKIKKIIYIDKLSWICTPKGEIDRKGMIESQIKNRSFDDV